MFAKFQGVALFISAPEIRQDTPVFGRGSVQACKLNHPIAVPNSVMGLLCRPYLSGSPDPLF
jgi:hypothetical protein